MSRFRLSPRTQLIIVIIVSLLILAFYGNQRVLPKYNELSKTSQRLTRDKQHVAAPVFPDIPIDDVELLKEKSETLGTKLSLLNEQFSSLEGSLAPIDTQDALLKISQTARTAGVRVIESVPYIVQRRLSKKEKLAQNASKKPVNIAEQRKARNERKKARRLTKKLGLANATIGAKTIEGELMDRLVNGLDEARMLQRVSVQGTFANLKKFIQSIQALPWQITVVKLDMNINTQTPPRGVPQPLTAKFIIAI